MNTFRLLDRPVDQIGEKHFSSASVVLSLTLHHHIAFKVDSTDEHSVTWMTQTWHCATLRIMGFCSL